MNFRCASCLMVVLTAVQCFADETAKPVPPLAETAPHPHPVDPPSREKIDAAIRRGIDFLLADQRPDGCWGSAERTKDLNIYAPVPGAHHAFRSATTALCVSALIDVKDNRPEVAAAIDRGEAWLLAHLPTLRRAEAMAIYNVWGHAFGIQALVKLHHYRAADPAKQAELVRHIQQQIELLDRYETVHGGWGYYDFRAGTQKPAGEPTSFTTATVLLAFDDAKKIGIDAPQKLSDRGLAVIRRQRRPDGAFLYDDAFRFNPQFSINLPGGSLGRSQVCNLCLRRYGDDKMTDAVLSAWLDRLFARNLWLDIGRKRPIPHESWFFVAGYFYYYGHYYAAECIAELPAAARPPHYGQLANLLVNLQEKDGSWWDYVLYNYHQQYGTAFALMSLTRCRPVGQASSLP
jgi:squalene cyclase